MWHRTVFHCCFVARKGGGRFCLLLRFTILFTCSCYCETMISAVVRMVGILIPYGMCEELYCLVVEVLCKLIKKAIAMEPAWTTLPQQLQLHFLPTALGSPLLLLAWSTSEIDRVSALAFHVVVVHSGNV
jgi:hypothetical protein